MMASRNSFQVPSLDLGSLRQGSPNIKPDGQQEQNITSTTPDSASGYDIQYGTEVFKGIEMFRTDTPNTLLADFPNKPDITLKCEKCGYFVNIVDLKEHRKYHGCLLLMKYKGDSLPQNVDELFRRRGQLIKKLKQMAVGKSPPDPQHIQQINEAYEYLKANLEDTYEEFRQIQSDVDTQVNGVALNCSPSCAYAVGIASSSNQRWKKNMEDTRVYQDYFGEDPSKCYLGIFDGHNGHFAAEAAATELHGILLNEMQKFDPKTKSTVALNMVDENTIATHRPMTQESERANLHEDSVKLVQQIIAMCEEKYAQLMGDNVDNSQKAKSKFKNPFSEKISEAIKKAYQLFDIFLSYGKDEHSKVRWSGCSSLNVIIQDTAKADVVCDNEDVVSPETPKELGLLHLANAGNVRGVLVRGNRSYQLTKDHTPKNRKERERVIKAGCSVNVGSKDCRVNGILSTTRGLGNHGDLKLKKSVLVEPYTTCVTIDQYAQFLCMASNGVWEVFSDQEVASLLLKHIRKTIKNKLLPCNQVPPPSQMSESVELLISKESSNIPDIILEKGTAEENTSTGRKETRVDGVTIYADLKTEVGSHCGEDLDTSLHDNEMISMPVNCHIPDHKPETQSDFRRELAKSMAEHLVQAALLAGSRDNVTVMITLLPGCGV
ncbi:hypothetical protein SNE40_022628 [Patella caerulea]|uniref:PPM-type phosphatase domain-containing protein n=1 Tax=Patella caerulea TaxID=87958 RepID=A0AAN8IXU4_PATCE